MAGRPLLEHPVVDAFLSTGTSAYEDPDDVCVDDTSTGCSFTGFILEGPTAKALVICGTSGCANPEVVCPEDNPTRSSFPSGTWEGPVAEASLYDSWTSDPVNPDDDGKSTIESLVGGIVEAPALGVVH